MVPARRPQHPRPPTQTGLAHVDVLAANEAPALADYITAVSEYVRESPRLSLSAKKTAQIALSKALGRCLKEELEERVPHLDAFAGELNVAGALRTTRADVSESHPLDGLRLAVEIKPINLAVGRAIWNRFGDIRAFAVNIHLKFPFAVVGGILALPTWEWRGSARSPLEVQQEPGEADAGDREEGEPEEAPDEMGRVHTGPVIDRLVRRLARTPLRRSEADAPHLLEGVAVVVYDPSTATLDPGLPLPGSGLRWDEFVATLAETYDLRFE
jgi:hypothetical protein